MDDAQDYLAQEKPTSIMRDKKLSLIIAVESLLL